MATINKARALIDERMRLEEAIRLELIELFDEQADLENVQSISQNPLCLSVSAKDVFRHDVWDPEFYSLPKQWQRIQGILRSGEDLNAQLQRIESIAETGRWKTSEHGVKVTHIFHPEVVNRLRELLGGAA